MSGDTTLQALERLTHMPNRDGVQADRIAGQYYYDVEFLGGSINNVTLTDVTINGVETQRNERVITNAGNVTVQSDDYVVIVSKTVPEITTITLPLSPAESRSLILKDGAGNAASFPITVSGNGKNIDGETTKILNVDYEGTEIIFNDVDDQWNVIGSTRDSDDVSGPGSSTDNAIALFDGTTGQSIQNSTVTIDPSTGVMSGASIDTANNTIKVAGTSLTSKTGTGAVVLSNSPTLVTPALGTPSALIGTNITGTASGLTAGNVTTNANLTGPITSVGNATSIASQTGTGTKFVVDTSPTLITPVLGVATATSLNGVSLSGGSSPALTVTGTATVSGSNTGDQTITLTGDVTGSGTGSFATAIKSSVALAGSPTTTTQTPGDNSTKIATTAFVASVIAGSVSTTGSPATGNLTKFSGASSITNGDLSGDVTTSGTLVATLATVNANVGSFGSATASSTFTVNAKGLITAASSATVTPAESSVTFTDIATNNASTTKHGYMPKLSNSATLYFDSLGTQTNPNLNAVLTGYVSGAGTVSATDTTLTAIQKLNGNIASLPAAGLTTITSGNLATGSPTLVDITSIPATYRSLVLYVNGASNSVATRGLVVSVDTGLGLGNAGNAATWTASNTTTLSNAFAIANQGLWPITTQTAAQTSSCVINFPAYQSGPIKTFNGNAALAQTSGNDWGGSTNIIVTNGVLTAPTASGVARTGAIVGIRITWDNVATGVFDGGTYALYGVN